MQNTYHRQTAQFIATVCQNIPSDMKDEVMQGWIQNPKSLQKVLRDVFCPPATMSAILEFIGTTVIPAITGKFVARKKFVVDTSSKAKVKIRYLGDNFTEWFLSGDGKTEDPIGEQTLRYAKLKKSSVDAPIITELGGEEKSETALSSVYGLMEQQPNGEEGALLTNCYASIFYVRDQNGVLRAVLVHWSGVGWGVNAHSVESPYTWHVGYRVFSRNSVLDPSATVSAQA